MKLLLDTHVFLWLRFAPEKLSQPALAAYQNKQNQAYLSLASILEMQIKQQLGKLELDIELSELVQKQCEHNDIQLLPITLTHILNLQTLPFHHKDPFDRLLISQANSENMTLLTVDALFSNYDVQILW
ncbi:type II toxin-antitoxin system VapC family toxin [Candidatus Albibeggiatoa sp. nov. BB20]|uniref:type II toxin-antitoxin system VapC family toxin n=1 Tax=Candidatus Albibeggiatoa sp. nov. BB20 TaxID=3162723 RepID=UPI0033656A63